MAKEPSPLLFEARLGGLFPANAVAEAAMQETRGRVRVVIKSGVANERRRGLYWSVAALVVPLLNQLYTLTLDEDDLHDISRRKLKLFDGPPQQLPSGEMHYKLKSTSARAMPEHERAAYTDKALALWSTWVGVDVTVLREAAEQSP